MKAWFSSLFMAPFAAAEIFRYYIKLINIEFSFYMWRSRWSFLRDLCATLYEILLRRQYAVGGLMLVIPVIDYPFLMSLYTLVWADYIRTDNFFNRSLVPHVMLWYLSNLFIVKLVLWQLLIPFIALFLMLMFSVSFSQAIADHPVPVSHSTWCLRKLLRRLFFIGYNYRPAAGLLRSPFDWVVRLLLI